MGWFDKLSFSRLAEGLTKTRVELVGKINRLITASGKIDPETLDRIEEILIEADVGAGMSLNIVEKIRDRVKENKYQTPEELDRLIRDEVIKIIAMDESSIQDPFEIPEGQRPFVVLVVGVNGVGKTTTIGKLAHIFKEKGLKVIVGAADTYRAAANEQLEIWAKKVGVEVIRQGEGADPAAVAYDSVASAISNEDDVVIVDTAGRLHTRMNLMEELKKIKRVIGKHNPAMPHEVLLVLDASTGQNAVLQARQFDSSLGITGLVVTKLDGTAKGGIIFAIVNELNIPVKYIGVGEKPGDLQPFSASMYVEALFSSGYNGERTNA